MKREEMGGGVEKEEGWIEGWYERAQHVTYGCGTSRTFPLKLSPNPPPLLV